MRSAAAVFLGFCALLPCRASADFASRILAAHNAERSALELPPLAWSDTLASRAAAWANELSATGQLEHSPRSTRDGEGENLWMGTAGAYTLEDMVGGWVDEKRYFVDGTFPDVTTWGDWHVVGHYTQIIWKSTLEVGCAEATGKGEDYLVCRYSPAGNLVGEKPY